MGRGEGRGGRRGGTCRSCIVQRHDVYSVEREETRFGSWRRRERGVSIWVRYLPTYPPTYLPTGSRDTYPALMYQLHATSGNMHAHKCPLCDNVHALFIVTRVQICPDIGVIKPITRSKSGILVSCWFILVATSSQSKKKKKKRHTGRIL